MIALVNAAVIPFFDRIPPRAIPVVRRAIERIRHQELGSQTTDFSYNLFCTELRAVDIAGPSVDEWAVWVRDVQTELAEIANDLAGGLSSAAAKARTAYRIVAMAVSLQQAMIDGGYSPDSVELENQIVAEAIKEWLTAEAKGWGEAMNIPYSPGEMAMSLLSSPDSDQNAKLLDVFALHMQRELAQAIVKTTPKENAQ
ncbi:hypothetical protein GB927_012680 [Shinella sp. CPCC 100929]|uniref:Uncharacterized protein n=1 Tax=Shinella lacus TaxID=2654216 RepID=A0ABT1R6U5_9HYPH|nr:hypothetical protein [Shinella lacus]MCQ4630901.1 hypothetical protein [Shinella lacus]